MAKSNDNITYFWMKIKGSETKGITKFIIKFWVAWKFLKAIVEHVADTCVNYFKSKTKFVNILYIALFFLASGLWSSMSFELLRQQALN